ncbi:MAG: hypothetical protein COA78_28035 [Blastopirellula sp.]|nr:MAG: hypothetical protein COA78_28035 [Blastopirellula sp.]
MKSTLLSHGLLSLGLCCSLMFASVSLAADGDKKEEKKAPEIKLADGKIILTAPKAWKVIQPRVRIIDHEFSVEAAKEDKVPGRVTIMGAGGSIEDNIARWVGQFSGAKKAPVVEKKIAGQTVYLVDISGGYTDRRGPFAPATKYENFRMLAAIIKTDKLGQYFVKFYGPAKTVESNAKQFKAMIESLEVK